MPELRDGVYIQTTWRQTCSTFRPPSRRRQRRVLPQGHCMSTESPALPPYTRSWLGPEEVSTNISLSQCIPSGVHQKETTAGTELNTAPSASQENITHNHKELHAEAVEDSIVALSWPWFIPIEEGCSGETLPKPLPLHCALCDITA
ncbi:hypothetical protein SKAU_G00319600 [Synaphobranchus kaupii]|uniref:Uncharacterized protein n=1 Tax=Synaphobranchus kaupii TaxID=118154 RepID=A0A9Q1IJE9_SYNKA|nr:hypothetical protein SKAU_G00319600 [Synaphobranchus kaupii]